ncbi:MAG TPA: DUF4255 domain-containing protein [Clostridia bacterium]|nr:DUF4255 domain-containing protein [Clostridia bacterium]
MGSFTAIADIGDTLIALLQNNMKDVIDSANSIILGLPDNETPRISLFLYKVEENASLKNQNMIQIDNESYQHPPLALDLHYILTVYSNTAERIGTSEEHRILGRAMQVMNDNMIITGSVLQGGLKDSSDEFRISLNPMSMDEITKVWSTFPKLAYRTSVAYLVTPVSIESLKINNEKRVLTGQFNFIQKGLDKTK